VLTTRVEQNLRGARVVKTFAQEDSEIERFEAENKRWFDLSAISARLQSFNMPILNLIANVSSVVILWYGGSLVINHQLTLGELVAFTTYVAQLVSPVRFLGMILPAISMAGASAERVFEILDTLPEVSEEPDAGSLTVKRGHVQFKDVTFSYGRHRGVLKGISFEALPNQVIALLGPTGSGKSTIVNLIPRFYDPTEGCITIDGQNIRQVTINSLRSQIGMVLQETTLFAASIRENITFGRPDASQAEIEAAARAAQAHDFIMQMPPGYDTHVGERGVTLSGGQKQRLAIARAILTDPRILILDDATSSVDTETEHLIQLALERVMHGRTTFVIAHRLSTVQRADLILVLDKGRIVARGKHDELMRTSPLYQKIYEQQLKPTRVHAKPISLPQ
jgi:ABC-type multidrug transport system fused ATPase/permease subunit